MIDELLPDDEIRGSSRTKGGLESENDYLAKMKAVIQPALGIGLLSVLDNWEAFERSKGYPLNMTVS